MAFKSVNDQKPKKRKMLIGVIKERTETDGFYFKVEDDCTLILYKDGEYYKLSKSNVKIINEGTTVMGLEVDLSSPKQVELKGTD